ncbi:MAG TPA: restriction endonuclease subunit S [Methanolinea sp.]|nr:restriction endonuclease subunit S [Methanolinea sp.]
MHIPNWKTQLIKDVCEEIFSGGTPSTKEKKYWDGDIFWLSSGEIKSRYICNTERKITQLGVDNSSTRLAKKGDTLVASAGQGNTRGNSALSKVNTYINQSIIALRPDKQKIDAKFLFFNLTNRYSELRNLSDSNSSRGSLTCKLIENLPINLPPLPTQRKIAAILSAYDNLIENNTRRIKILEEMAQAIYREWFVHFRFPGHEGVRMVESELGMIPEGWEVRKLGDIAEEVRKSVDPNNLDPNTPYVGLEHVPRKSIALTDWGLAEEVQSTKHQFFIKEILFGKIRPYFHKVVVAPIDGICSSDAIVIRPIKAEFFALVLFCVSSEDFVNHATQTSQGTKMPRANWNVLVNYSVVIPPKSLLEEFNRIVFDIVDIIITKIFQNNNLRRTRDLLLPKLISGELDVSELDIGE